MTKTKKKGLWKVIHQPHHISLPRKNASGAISYPVLFYRFTAIVTILHCRRGNQQFVKFLNKSNERLYFRGDTGIEDITTRNVLRKDETRKILDEITCSSGL